MNYQSIISNNFINRITDFDSDKLGLYFSFIIHFIIFLFAIGIPNFFEPKPINIPNIIPIEIINVTDVTSIPDPNKNLSDKKTATNKVSNKKFNNSEKKNIEKIDIKDKPIIQKQEEKKIDIFKEDKLAIEKIKEPVDLKKDKPIKDFEKTESLPVKEIKPKIKPQMQNTNSEIIAKSDVVIKKKPKIQKKSDFDIASMLKDLRNDSKSILQNKDEEKIEKEKNISNEENNEENATLSISEIDFLIQQLSSCWTAPAGAVIKKGMVVKIAAKIKQNGEVLENTIRIIDTNIAKNNSFYGPITESAMRTLLNPECIPLRLPRDKYNLWKNITITFDHSIMKVS